MIRKFIACAGVAVSCVALGACQGPTQAQVSAVTQALCGVAVQYIASQVPANIPVDANAVGQYLCSLVPIPKLGGRFGAPLGQKWRYRTSYGTVTLTRVAPDPRAR